MRGKQIYYHRWFMEQHLERQLDPKEVVHHINGDKTDNRIENLEVMNISDHLSNHKKGTNKARKGWSHEHTECVQCGSNERKHRGRGLCTLCFSRDYEEHRPPRIR